VVAKGDVVLYQHPEKGIQRCLVAGIRGIGGGNYALDLARMDESLQLKPHYIGIALYAGEAAEPPARHCMMPAAEGELGAAMAQVRSLQAELAKRQQRIERLEEHNTEMERLLGKDAPQLPPLDPHV